MPIPEDTTRIERRPARHEVFERLRSWIESGSLAPGEVLKDSDIAKQLGVSRTPVREALQQLEQSGAVEMLPGRLTRVTELTPEDAHLAYAPLSVLQALAAEVGTPRASDSDVEEMAMHNEQLLEAIETDEPLAAHTADRAFHGVLVRLADNRFIVQAIDPMLLHIRRLEAIYFADMGPGRESYEEHGAILTAVAEGDARRAQELTRRNFQRYWRAFDPRQTPDAPRS